jgi:hypothetical protein
MVISHVPVMSTAVAEAGNSMDTRPQIAIVNETRYARVFI